MPEKYNKVLEIDDVESEDNNLNDEQYIYSNIFFAFIVIFLIILLFFIWIFYFLNFDYNKFKIRVEKELNTLEGNKIIDDTC